jgi:hypothetical protein
MGPRYAMLAETAMRERWLRPQGHREAARTQISYFASCST